MTLLPQSLAGRVALLLVASLGAVVVAGGVDTWFETREHVETLERTRISTLVDALGPEMDGDRHELAVSAFPERDAVDDWSSAPTWVRAERERLVRGQRAAVLETPVYTLRLRDEARERVLAEPNRKHPDAMEFVLTTSEEPYWRHRFEYLPQMAPTILEGRSATTPIYTDSQGTWISAYAPVRDSAGNVVAILQADAHLDVLLASTREGMARKAIVPILLFVVALMGALAIARRMTHALSDLERAAGRLGAGDLRTPFVTGSSLREVRSLTGAFEQARQRLDEHGAEQRRLIESLERARVDAEAAGRSKAAFLANMSHELRTPMNSVVGFADLLMDTELDGEQQEMADTIHRAGTVMVAIIGDILEFAKIDAGRVEVVHEPMEPEGVVADVCDLLQHQARSKRISLSWFVDPAVPRWVLGDAGRARQVLLNLVGNAIKFTDSGGVDVGASVASRDGETLRLRFRVRDTGIGIAPENRARLFQPFTQVDESVTRRYGGTGLGLAISKELVGLMDGEIGVASEREEGSTFWFTVQVGTIENEAALEVPEPALPSRAAVDDPHAARPRILVVEDNPVNRRVAASIARRLGYATEVACDGSEALERLAAKPFDAILMDCHMPVMDGYETTRRIRAQERDDRHLPIIALTADALEENLALVTEAGMDAFVSKPAQLAELARVLDRWCPVPGGQARGRLVAASRHRS